jgi:glycyl-tRNA synthetase alpha subunit
LTKKRENLRKREKLKKGMTWMKKGGKEEENTNYTLTSYRPQQLVAQKTSTFLRWLFNFLTFIKPLHTNTQTLYHPLYLSLFLFFHNK